VIEIEVHLFPPLRENRFDRAAVTLAAGATVQSLLAHLDIREREVESVYVNGRGATFAQPLSSGDRVTLLPTIGGG
jgi:molybdopterin converting factor small subunit